MKQHQQTSIANIKGIGPETEKTLNELGIYDISDLLNYFLIAMMTTS